MKHAMFILALPITAIFAAGMATGRYTAPVVKPEVRTIRVVEPGPPPLPEVTVVYRTKPGACKAVRTRAYRVGWESGHRTCRMDRGEPR